LIKNNFRKNGFTLTPALLILVILIISGTTYLVYTNVVARTNIKIEITEVSKYVAETGLFYAKAQLASVTELDSNGNGINKWFNAKNPLNTSQFLFPSSDNNNRNSSNTSRISDYINLENTNVEVSKFRITLEDGSIVANSKTITNSTVAGFDKYGNKIWSNSTDKNYFKDTGAYRYGIKVDAIVQNAGKESKQSIYAVIDVPVSTVNFAGPDPGFNRASSFMLATNGGDTSSSPLNLLSNQIITGPIHSNSTINFTWKGNFDILMPLGETYRRVTSKKNDVFTVTATRYVGANTADPSPPLIFKMIHEAGQPSNVLTLLGQNFSTSASNGSTVGNYIVFYNDSPASTTVVADSNIQKISTTKLRVTIPASFTKGRISISTYESKATNSVYLDLSQISINQPDVGSTPQPPNNVLGIMQVSRVPSGLETEYIYSQVNDYRLYLYDNPSTTYNDSLPYVVWDPPGEEPAAGRTYRVTYITPENIPHKKIIVYAPLTYSGKDESNNPKPIKYYYNHSHKSNYTNALYPYVSDHDHRGNIFGMPGINLLTASRPNSWNILNPGQTPTWEKFHQHEMTGYNLGTNYTYDNFFQWGIPNDFSDDAIYKPTFVNNSKLPPIVKPNNFNFYTQREYANQILKLILGKELKRDSSGNLESLPNQEDRANGYYLGNGGVIDFRATYFGNELKYSIGPNAGQYVLPLGSPIDATAVIYVNDNKNSPDFLKVASIQINSDYKLYTYRQIPKNAPILSKDKSTILQGGIIFVKDAAVRIGGVGYKGNVMTGYVDNTRGNYTIIDGRLTIISYSETKPTSYINNDLNSTTDNPGDIVITGNIIYKNKIYKYKEQLVSSSYTHEGFRQYKREGLLTATSMNDSNVTWITNIGNDGTIDINKEAIQSDPTLKVNSLGLYASNDIKIPVIHYYQDQSETFYDPAKEDELTIHGQLIAGHQITQTKAGSYNTSSSKSDRIILLGSFYSFEVPNLSYFDRDTDLRLETTNVADEGPARIYIFDKTLSDIPLGGSPNFPKDSTYKPESQQIVGTLFPKIVPGTWKNVSGE